MAINFSPLQVESSLPARLAALIERHKIRPESLVVEITEAELLQGNPEVLTTLDQIRRFGCRIALDDFGTGYSSLSYLNRFPVDIVKVDQSFVRALTAGGSALHDRSRMLVEGIATISHKMACTVIAEGIETQEQWRILLEMGVDCGQGYLFSRPLPIDALSDMMHNDIAQARTPA